jgi:hypothetical protein
MAKARSYGEMSSAPCQPNRISQNSLTLNRTLRTELLQGRHGILSRRLHRNCHRLQENNAATRRSLSTHRRPKVAEVHRNAVNAARSTSEVDPTVTRGPRPRDSAGK